MNDTPFVDQPSPPRSPSQPTKDADVRGQDFALSEADDEYTRAVAYRDSIQARVKAKDADLALLAGSRAAYASLQRKTLPLARSSPPHYEGP